MNLIICPFVVGPQMTKNAIISMLGQDVECHVLAIANGSRDGTVQTVRAMVQHRRLHLVEYGTRYPLNKLWNEWIEYAFTRLHLDCVMVVNNDVVLRADTFRLLRDDGSLFVTAVGVNMMTEGSE